MPAVQGVERRNGGTVVRLAGELDLYNANDVAATLEEVSADGQERIVIDLSEVAFVDSTALGTLVEARKQIGVERLVLAAPGHDVRRALEVSGLVQHFAVAESVDDALS